MPGRHRPHPARRDGRSAGGPPGAGPGTESRRRHDHLRRRRRHDARQHARTAARTGLLPRPGRGRAERRRRLRQPRGDAHRCLRIAQVRRPESAELLRLPRRRRDYAALPRRGRLHGDERRQQPLLRLRRSRARTDDRGAARRAGSPRPACPARSPWSRRAGSKVAFVGFAPYANTASLLDLDAARALIRRRPRRADDRRRRDPRRRRGNGRPARHRRRGELPRRGPRQPRGLRADGGRRRRRPGARLRPARPARHGDLPRPADRLQPRQLLAASTTSPLAGCSARRRSSTSPSPPTGPSAPAGSPRCGWSKRASRCPTPKKPRPTRRRALGRRLRPDGDPRRTRRPAAGTLRRIKKDARRSGRLSALRRACLCCRRLRFAGNYSGYCCRIRWCLPGWRCWCRPETARRRSS